MGCSLDILIPLHDASNSRLFGAIVQMKIQKAFTDICTESQYYLCDQIFVSGKNVIMVCRRASCLVRM
jgi:hypothetical protein